MELRDKLLQITQEMDKQMEQRVAQIRKALEQILASPNTEEAVVQVIPLIDDLFMQELESMLAASPISRRPGEVCETEQNCGDRGTA